mmetsp:Transcript_29838/g.71118  ORF Transcript_29838/g.71118 Transcript_29838/m.71118 type:complete len:235 (-) Transcript_29838:328-1032(-)
MPSARRPKVSQQRFQGVPLPNGRVLDSRPRERVSGDHRDDHDEEGNHEHCVDRRPESRVAGRPPEGPGLASWGALGLLLVAVVCLLPHVLLVCGLLGGPDARGFRSGREGSVGSGRGRLGCTPPCEWSVRRLRELILFAVLGLQVRRLLLRLDALPPLVRAGSAPYRCGSWCGHRLLLGKPHRLQGKNLQVCFQHVRLVILSKTIGKDNILQVIFLHFHDFIFSHHLLDFSAWH